ncbi:transmembrane protein, putative [Rhizoctonia solani AG-3 Rhs1AP]|uniref:Transmembrane protein, putative n=1 Tax=Rhizoctonia solani AG-3 Rhs1AP TaxID=1086054 RepID=X8J1A6_9AGAM|nr:transmembrane protein, putative [Rhizoctonia solani AG-3 Rhs1AP]
MSFSTLPPELIYLVIQFINPGLATLQILYAINRRMHQIACPLVFRFVQLGSTTSVDSFCHTVTSLRPSCSRYITSLQVGPQYCVNSEESIQLSKGLLARLRRAIETLDNLKSLSLMVSRQALAELLNGLTVSFKLDTFIHSGEFSMALLHFLERQTSLTKLGWYGSTTRSDADVFSNSMRANPGLLPKLRSLDGVPPILTALIPLRPISSVTILPVLGDEVSIHLAAFGNSLAQSMVPITCICTVEDRRTRGTWGWVIVELRERHAAFLHLKEIQVIKLSTLDNDQRDWESEGILMGIYPSFLRFNALEKLEFKVRPVSASYRPSRSNIHGWLARCEMQHPSSWMKNNPSLSTIILYGHVIS